MQNITVSYLEYLFKDTVKQVYGAPYWMIQPDSQAVFLDCGCGDGEYSRALAKILGTEKVCGIELNKPMASCAVRNGIGLVNADLNQVFPIEENSIHVLTAFNVLEHLVETDTFISEVYRVLFPGGYTIMDTPNLASWHNIAALVLGLQPFSGPNITSMSEADVSIVRRLHRRSFHLPEGEEEIRTTEPERHRHIVVVAYRSLIKALKRTGFIIEYAMGYGYYPFPPPLSRWLSHLDPWHAHHMTIMARKPQATPS